MSKQITKHMGRIVSQIKSKKIALSDTPVKKVNLPFKQIENTSIKVWENLKNSSEAYSNELMAKILNELLTCQMRFLTGIYLSIFLQKDYYDEHIDSRVYNFFKGLYGSYNELIGLCGDIASFLKWNQEKSKNSDERELYVALNNFNFNVIKLKTPPITDSRGGFGADRYIEFGSHIMDIMKKFVVSIDFINDLKIEYYLNQSCHNNLKIFQSSAENFLTKGKISKHVIKEFEHQTGDCFLCISDTCKIRLDPMIIPLKSKDRDFRFATLSRFYGYQTTETNPIVYHELCGDGVVFTTSNPDLFRKLFATKGLVSELPSFSRQYTMPESDIMLQLYQGDIFNLNFLENSNEMVMVNLLNKDLSCKTPLSIGLEILDGDGFFQELKKQIGNKSFLDANKLYVTERKKTEYTKNHSDKQNEISKECKEYNFWDKGLRFKYIFHCPIYGIESKKDNNLEVINNSIQKILEVCITKQVKCLIVPAMGSFWAGQLRKKVAKAWYHNIRTHSGLEKSNLKRIIFSFINEETCNEYQNFFSSRTGEQFKGYHLPIYSMYDNIISSCVATEKINLTLDLCSYLYCFMTAWAIRSLMWEKLRVENQGKPFKLNDKQSKFVTELCENAGLKESKTSAWSKSIGLGHWRELTKLGYDAIVSKSNDWSFNKWYDKSTKKQENIINDFINGGGEFDYPQLRNSIAHSTWHSISEIDQNELAEDSVKKIESIIRNIPFIKNEKNKMVQIKRFSVEDDTGEVSIKYIQLSEQQKTSPFGTLNSKKDALDGRFFEIDAVYLIENLEDDSVKALNLHPFILHGDCKICKKPRLYIWRDFLKNNNNSLEIKYGSIGCGCAYTDNDLIAGYEKKGLEKRFYNILEQLQTCLK